MVLPLLCRTMSDATRAFPDGVIAGFERHRLIGHEVEIDALIAGRGPPLLLLHGDRKSVV